MKLLLAVFALVATVVTFPAMAADGGVSIQVGEPGFYGRIDIGNAPPPQVIYTRPVVIYPPPLDLERAPIYLRVPPEHAKHWRKYCRQYNACGQPVYFVQDRWYRDEYVPRYREHERQAYHEDRQHDNGRDEEREHDHERDHDHEHGKDHRKD